MPQIIVPGQMKFVIIQIPSGQTTGTVFHYMGTTPNCGRPNPNFADGATATAYATADNTQVTVTCETPVSQDTIFTVMVMI